MGSAPLLPLSAVLSVQWIRFDQIVQIGLGSTGAQGTCPCCGSRSSRVHGYHVRTVADSPAHGRTVELKVRLRRFVCQSPDCPRRTFAEQMPDLMPRRSRKTGRLIGSLEAIALALGAEAGARLAGKLGIPVSPDTLLRVIRKIPATAAPTPRVLGVDDWSFKRGRRFGTILCDLESHQVVGLLPDRSASTLSQWLQTHPGVELISRDRGGEYARGAALGAPQAPQIADRFHLVRNLMEAFERALDRQQALLCEAAQACTAAPAPAPVHDARQDAAPAALTRRQERHLQSRQRRKALYDQVKQLQAQGASLRQIARQLRLNPHTVQRYAHSGQFPERASYPGTPKTLAPYMADLKRRWDQGCRNAVKLHRQLQEGGFGGSVHMVRRQLAAWRGQEQPTRHAGSPWRPSARAVAWLLLKEQKRDAARKLGDKEQAFLAALHHKWPQLAGNLWMVGEFSRVLSQDDPAQLQAWVDLTREPTILPPLRQFAKNLRRDWDAVVEAVGRANMAHHFLRKWCALPDFRAFSSFLREFEASRRFFPLSTLLQDIFVPTLHLASTCKSLSPAFIRS